MTRPIEEGNKVVVYRIISNKKETWTEELRGTVVGAPVATGGSWCIRDSDGKVHMINHPVPNFLKMVKES